MLSVEGVEQTLEQTLLELNSQILRKDGTKVKSSLKPSGNRVGAVWLSL